MSQEDIVKMQLIAAGRGTTVGGVMIVNWQRGMLLTRVVAGVVAATLDPSPAPEGGLTAADGYIEFLTNTAGGLNPVTVDTTDFVKTTTMQTAAGVATDSAFSIKIYRRLS